MGDQKIDHFLQAIPEESSYNTNSAALSPSQDSISSLDGTHFWSISLDDTPILPAIDGKVVKSFEELVEEALKRDDSPVNLDDSDKPKKPFLKKGSGLTRFAPKSDGPRRERRNCCKKKLEQQFRSEADKCVQKSDQYCPSKLEVTKTNGSARSKKVTIKSVPQVTKRSGSINAEIENGLNRYSVEPKKVQPNRRSLSGQGLSNVILSQYSSDFEPIQQKRNNVISHGLISTDNNTKSPKISTKDKKVNFEDDEPRVAALERLLKNIRMKQNKLKQLQELQSDEDSWEDEFDESEMIRKEEKMKNLTKSKINKKLTRTGTFTLGKTNANKHVESNPLSAPKVSNYTLSLKRKIETLEDRLHQLTAKCQQNIEDYKSREAPSEEKFSPEKIFSEMNEIKKHLFSLSNKLETIETRLLTKESQTKGLKINLPSSSAKVLASPETSLYSQIQQLQTGTHLTLNNGDQIMKTSDNTIIYSYISGVRQITYTDGTRVVEFPSGQIERVGTNGTKTIFYPNGTQRVIRPDGSEETITPDGTIIRVSVDGTEIIELSNGEREIRTGEFKRREYLDGTIKTIHVDGTEETRFANGRLRIKDKEGNLIADSLITQFKHNLT